jgi:large subunit ribosomal protein L22
MEAIAKLTNTRGSARKARLVVDLIRGKDVDEALNILKYSNKHVSSKIEKLLESAINNWDSKNEGLRPEDSDLYVKEAFVDGGLMMKRYRPAPFGRAHRIRKRMSHITLVVDSRLVVEEEGHYEDVEEITETQETEE